LDEYLAKIFSNSRGCLFILLIVVCFIVFA
jgi:hypothetical protein